MWRYVASDACDDAGRSERLTHIREWELANPRRRNAVCAGFALLCGDSRPIEISRIEVKQIPRSGRSPIPVAYCHTEEEPTNGCPCRSDTIFDIVKRDRAA